MRGEPEPRAPGTGLSRWESVRGFKGEKMEKRREKESVLKTCRRCVRAGVLTRGRDGGAARRELFEEMGTHAASRRCAGAVCV